MEQTENICLDDYLYGDIFLTKSGCKAKYFLKTQYAYLFIVEGKELLWSYDSEGNDLNHHDELKLIKKIGYEIRKS